MLKFLIEKEFKQIVRNSFLPRIIVFMPVMMMLIMPWAANQEIKGLKLSVVDNDHSTLSQRLIHKAASSGYFKLTDVSASNDMALHSIESGKADIILEIGADFEKNLIRDGRGAVMISVNAVSGIQAGLGSSYLSSIIADYSTELRSEYPEAEIQISMPSFKVMPLYKFNPRLDYKFFMVPAMMVMLLTMLTGFLPALNIVGEKEAGTIEQINVTPVRKTVFVLAKLIPYWTIGFIVLSICMGLAALVYGIVPAGSLLTIYLFASVYILVVSGLGLVISNYSDTMQQAMFVMYFFMIVLILMSGLFTPVSSMPGWAQNIAAFNPLKYFMEVMRLVYLKGSGVGEMVSQFLTLCLFALVLNTWAVLSYRKNS